MGGDGQHGRFLLSNRCKILTALSFVIVFAEIISVHRWETSVYASEYLWPKVYGYGTLVAANSITAKTKTPSTAKASHASMTHDHVKPTIQKPEAHNVSQIQRLASGGVRISKDLQNELNRRLKAATDKKVILVWIPPFGVKDAATVNATQCGNCEVTYDRSKINNENVGAVIFHFDAINAKNMPPKRNLNQLYIFWDQESTATLRIVRGHSLQFEDSFKFNATMTYRRDSEFYHSYGGHSIENIVRTNDISLEELLKMKTKVAVAIVSNCGYTPGARTRMKMLKELMSLNFGMEGYGNCFKGPDFPRGGRDRNSFTENVRKYKFYFSFENSYHCKDYITEKFFNNGLISLAVPVVWGATKEEYEAVAPLGSFIFAEDFSSMRDLSEYLKYLDGNDTAYLEYFRWLAMKPSDMPQFDRAQAWCSLCRALHGINIDDVYSPKFDENHMKRPLFTDAMAKRTVEHLIQWFYGEDHPECFGR